MQITGNVRSSSTTLVNPRGAMVVQKLATGKVAKPSSLIASKIKTKIANTSSFFKVSLKTNNKALALALEAQKEKSRHLESEIVYLRKEVESLCFDLALRRYKQNQLVTILKDLKSNALSSLTAAVDLLSHDGDVSDVPEMTNDEFQPTCEETSTKLGRKQANNPFSLAKSQNSECSVQLKRQTPLRNVSDVVSLTERSEAAHSIPTSEHRTLEGNESQANMVEMDDSAPKTKPATSLKVELERSSKIYSDADPEMDKDVTDNALSTASATKKVDSVMEGHGRGLLVSSMVETSKNPPQQERTLFDTEMEVTFSDDTVEIDAVETKPKNTKKKNAGEPVRKEKVQADTSHPLEKEKKQVKNSSTQRKNSPKVDCSLTVRETEAQKLENPGSPPQLREGVNADQLDEQRRMFESVVARRKTHVTSRSTKRQRSNREVPREPTAGDETLWPCHNGNNALFFQPEDDFIDPEVQSNVSKDKEIPLDANVQNNKIFNLKNRQTYIVSTCKSTENKTCIIDNYTTYYNDRVFPARMGDELAHAGCSVELGPPHSDAGAVLATNSSEPPQDLFQENPQPSGELMVVGDVNNLEDLIMKEIPCWEYPNTSSIIDTKSRKTSKEGTIRHRRKKAQKDDFSLQEKEKLKTVCDQVKMGQMDVQNLASYPWLQRSNTARDYKEFQTEKLENLERTAKSETCRDNFRKTYVVCLGDGSGTGSFKSADDVQLIDLVTASVDGNLVKTKCQKEHKSVFADVAFQDCSASAYQSEDPAFNVPNSNGKGNKIKSGQSHAVSMRQDSFRAMRDIYVTSNSQTKKRNSKVTADHEAIGSSDCHSAVCGVIASAEEDTDIPGGALTMQMKEKGPCCDLTNPLSAPCSKGAIPVESSASGPQKEPPSVAVHIESTTGVAGQSSVIEGEVLKSITNTNWTVLEESGRMRRRGGTVISYKEPPINCKMRRGDKFTDTQFLRSPVFKEKRKKKQLQKQRHEASEVASP